MSEWKKVKLGDVCQIIDGDRGKNYPKNHEFFGSGYCLFLNTGNVTKEGFSFANNQFITKEKDELLHPELTFTKSIRRLFKRITRSRIAQR